MSDYPVEMGSQITNQTWRDLAWRSPTTAYVCCRLGDGVILDVNTTFLAWTGLEREEVLDEAVARLPVWIGARERRAVILELIRHGLARDIKVRYRHRSGEARVARLSADVVPLQGEACVFIAAIDVTQLTAGREAAMDEERAMLAERVRERTAALKQQSDRQAAIASIEPIVHQPSHLREVLEHVVRVATDSLPASGGANIILAGEQPDELVISASTVDVTAPSKRVPRIRPHGGVTRHVISQNQLVLISKMDEDRFGSRGQLEAYGLEAYMGVPLVAHGEVLGALFVFSKTAHHWTREEIEFVLALANRAALTISSVRLYENLAQANEALTQASRAKDEFLASMSHELRTPLNAILGMSEALQEGLFGEISEEQVRCLQVVRESGQHLLALIEDVLDLATIESGGVPLSLKPVYLPDVCQASIALVEPTVRKKGQQISVELDPLVTTIEADERRLKQVLVNLLANAVKFTPRDGAIGLTTEGDAAARVVRLIVWDHGIGIAPEDVERLFQPFVQLDSSLAKRFEGVGLGLALSARMVALHGGKLELQSSLGEGSRFVVSLPWRMPTLGDASTPLP